jgi:hypothetical protein
MGLAQRLQQRAKGLRFHARHDLALRPDRQHVGRQIVRVALPNRRPGNQGWQVVLQGDWAQLAGVILQVVARLGLNARRPETWQRTFVRIHMIAIATAASLQRMVWLGYRAEHPSIV